MTHLPEGNYLTTRDIAEDAGVPKITVNKWIERGHLTAIMIDGLGYLINEKDYEIFKAKERSVGQPKKKR